MVRALCLSVSVLLVAAAWSCTSPRVHTTIPDPVLLRWMEKPPSAWKKLSLGEWKGYRKTEWEARDPANLKRRATYWIYDQDFDLLGFYTDGGTAWRFGVRGRPEPLGQHVPEEAVRLIVLGQAALESERASLRVEHMDRPTF